MSAGTKLQNDRNPLDLIRELKGSYHLMSEIFTNGSCFKLTKILKTMFPSAVAMYSEKDGHWITKIDGKYYDIHGQLDVKYVKQQEYEEKDRTTEVSADVCQYGGQPVRYDRYFHTV